jgi:regulator of Ty1 transposition protein 103
LQIALTKATVNSNTSNAAATSEHDKLHDPKSPQPTLPVHAARLSQLLKTLANAENSVSEVIKSRRALIDGLEKFLETNRAELAKEESLGAELAQKKNAADAKKREVEDAIMSGLSNEDVSTSDNNNGHNDASVRPEVEALTPPPVEAITPVGSPQPEKQSIRRGPFTEDADDDTTEWPNMDTIHNVEQSGNGASVNAQDNGHAKRRKISHGEEDYAAFAGGDLDPDLADLVNQGQQ